VQSPVSFTAQLAWGKGDGSGGWEGKGKEGKGREGKGRERKGKIKVSISFDLKVGSE